MCRVGVCRERKESAVKLFSKNSNLYYHDTSKLVRTLVTDGQTDGQTTCHGNAALSVASRAKIEFRYGFLEVENPYKVVSLNILLLLVMKL